MRVVARKPSFLHSGHEAIILDKIELDDHPFLTKAVLIELCHSPLRAPAMLIPEKNVKLRLVIDYRQLKKQTIKTCWPKASIERIFDTLKSSC